MAEQLLYGTSGKFYVPLLLASTQNFASTGVITFASSDVTIVKDGSTYRDLTNTPTGVAMGNAGAVFEIVTSASEGEAKKIVIQLADSTVGRVWQDQMIIIDTYGASSAQHVSFPANVNQIGGSTSVFDNFEDDYDGTGLNKANSEIGTVAALTANNDKTGYGLSSTGIDDIWEEPVVGHASSSQFGGFILNRMDDQITSRASTDKTGYALASTAQNDIVDKTWDEVITNVIHNDANSAGKKLRQAAEGHIIVDEGTAQAGSSNTIQLSASADNVTDDIYNSAYVTILAGIGVGETNFIISYDAGTRTATMAHDWVITPTTTSEYMLTQSAMSNIHAIEDSHDATDNLLDDYDGTGYDKSNSAIGTVVNVSSDVSGKVVGAVGSVTGNVDGSVGSLTVNNDKTGYALTSTGINDVSTGVKSEINDLIFIDASSQSTGGSGGSLGNKIAAINERFFNHHQQDSSTQVVMKSGSTVDVKFVMTVTNTTVLQTVQEATTV